MEILLNTSETHKANEIIKRQTPVPTNVEHSKRWPTYYFQTAENVCKRSGENLLILLLHALHPGTMAAKEIYTIIVCVSVCFATIGLRTKTAHHRIDNATV